MISDSELDDALMLCGELIKRKGVEIRAPYAVWGTHTVIAFG